MSRNCRWNSGSRMTLIVAAGPIIRLLEDRRERQGAASRTLRQAEWLLRELGSGTREAVEHA